MGILRVRTDEDLVRCFPVLRELRPKLASTAELLLFGRELREEGGDIAAIEHEGEIATVAVFRIRTLLVSGRTLYVDDLVTAERFRSQGHGKAMLDWLKDHARMLECDMFTLDSGTFRHDAHAFYFREGLRATAFHFQYPL